MSDLDLYISQIKTKAGDLKDFFQNILGIRVSSARKASSFTRSEKNPSLHVYQDHWIDFGAADSDENRAGDAITAYKLTKICSTAEAIQELGQLYGLGDPPWIGSSKDLDGDLLELQQEHIALQVLDDAISYYEEKLLDFPDIIAELESKWGITLEEAKQYRIGFSDGKCVSQLRPRWKDSDLLSTGIFRGTRDDGPCDFFVGRIIFPYLVRGKVRNVIGRSTSHTPDVEWEKGKYKKLRAHSTERPFICKRLGNQWLFGEDDLASGSELIILTEGITDAIAARRAGYKCFSPVTVNLSAKNVEKAKNYVGFHKKIVVINDNDPKEDKRSPGLEGAKSGGRALYAMGHPVYVGQLPAPTADEEKVDLCSLVVERGKEALDEVVQNAKPFVEFFLEHLPEDLDERGKQLDQLLEALAGQPETVSAEWVKKIQQASGATRKELTKRVDTYRREQAKAKAEATKAAQAAAPIVVQPQRGDVQEGLGYYYVEVITAKGRRQENISSFSLSLRRILVVGNKRLVQCDIILTNGETVVADHIFDAKAWITRRSFNDALSFDPRLRFTGKDDEVMGVLACVMQREGDVPTAFGVTSIGYHELPTGPRWVWGRGALAPDGIMDSPDVFFWNSSGATHLDGGIVERINYGSLPVESDTRELLRKTLPLLFSVYRTSTALGVAAWFFACPFASRLRKILGHFPHLLLWGGPGSGKTTLILRVFWPLMGVGDPAGRPAHAFACNDTKFMLLKKLGSTNGVPIYFDEYKSDMGQLAQQNFERVLRSAYAGETVERGRSDLSTQTFMLEAPVVFTGEQQPEDPALQERTICFATEKNLIGVGNDMHRALVELTRLPLQELALPFIQWTLTQDPNRFLFEAREVLATLQEPDEHGIAQVPQCAARIHDSMLVVLFGAIVLERWAKSLGVDIPDTMIAPTLMALAGGFDEIGHTTGGDLPSSDERPVSVPAKGIRDELDRFIEEVSHLAHHGDVEYNKHYTKLEGRVCLHMQSCLDAVLVARQRRGAKSSYKLPTLMLLARSNHQRGGYVERVSHRVRLKHPWSSDGMAQFRCLVVSWERVPEYLDVIEFRGDSRKSGPKPGGGGELN